MRFILKKPKKFHEAEARAAGKGGIILDCRLQDFRFAVS
jgi:hypothetical protein